jgi:hypothetical protein
MAADPQLKPSFSPYRKWGIGLNATLLVLLVLSVVAMVNYLSQDYWNHRWHVSGLIKTPLSPRTVKFLQSMTNRVQVTVYYDKEEPFFSTVVDLLNEYRAVNSKVSIEIVDYKRAAGAAQRLKAKYPFLAARDAKNLVIFDSGVRVKPVNGNGLTTYITERVPNEKEIELRRRPAVFEGERAFTATLLDVTNPKPLKAYFLSGHGEHSIDTQDKEEGYTKFATVLRENCIEVQPPLSLLGTNTVPQDCALLVVAGPVDRLDTTESEKIEQFLREGGRMLALLNFRSLKRGETGLERLLLKWGVDVGFNVIADPDNHYSESDVIVHDFNPSHPVVNPLLESRLQLVLPRSIAKSNKPVPAAEALHVEELAFSGPKACLSGDPKSVRRIFPLIAAVEKGAIKGVITERGTTRMVVAGDSFFLDNQLLDSAANRDFAGFAVNWLLDRPQLLEAIGPRPVTEYKLVMTRTQLRSAEWIMLGAMPGGVLALGALVWLRRRR